MSGLRSMAHAQAPKLVIGNFEAPGLYDQAAQEIVTDRDNGYHNEGDPRHCEWWYFDLFTDSGLKAAVILMDRPLIMLDNPDLPPLLMLNVELPDGTNRDFQVPFSDEDFSAAEDHCDVKLGNN